MARIRHSYFLSGVLAVAAGLGGCASDGGFSLTQEDPYRITIEGVSRGDVVRGPTLVEVALDRGQVKIVEKDNLLAPVVVARRADSPIDNPHKNAKTAWMTAKLTPVGGTATLRVSGSPGSGESQPVMVEVQVPTLGGVKVRTSDGTVDVVDVRGAIDIANGSLTHGGNAIRVVTRHPLNQPVSMTTSSGSISLKAPEGSVWAIDGNAPQGRVEVTAPKARASGVYIAKGVWRGVLEGAEHPCVLSADNGNIEVRIGK